MGEGLISIESAQRVKREDLSGRIVSYFIFGYASYHMG